MVKVEVDQDRARALGISSQQLANNINAILSGTHDHAGARQHLSDRHRRPRRAGGARQARDLAQPDASTRAGGRSVPLAQIATLVLRARAAADLAPPAPADRDRAGRRRAGRRGRDRRQAARRRRSPRFEAKLPAGYDVVAGGTIEDSAKAQASIFAVFPLMLFLMVDAS